MSNDIEVEQINTCIQDIKASILPYQNVERNKPCYLVTHLHLAKLYFAIGEHLKAFYHLSECHGILLRHHAVLEDIRRQGYMGFQISSSALKWEYMSCQSDYALEEDKGLLCRLSEMPSEWTIIQLTRISSDEDNTISKTSNPKLKDLFVSRAPCGNNTDEIQVGYISNFETCPENILDQINNCKTLLTSTGLNAHTQRNRKLGSKTIQSIMNTFGEDMFSDWICVFLGKLQNEDLSNRIKDKIDNILRIKKYNKTLPSRVIQFLYLLAEGSYLLSPIMIRSSLDKNLPDDKSLKGEVYSAIIEVKESFSELQTARRHPVILIVEEHLDCIPWESMPVFKDNPVSRVISIHFLHALFKAHEDKIHFGLREISENKINYYIVNPDGNLPRSEAKLKPFFESRLPGWKGLIGKKPTPQTMIEALTTSNAYIYCGHGSGCQFLNVLDVQRLNLMDSIQLIFGCQSAALKHLGGETPMTGDMLNYCLAGSPCSLGMLYAVTSDDVDEMTMFLANHWLPGNPIDTKSFELVPDIKREPELLRVLPRVRAVPGLFSNGAALIARGLPITLIPSE